MVGLYLFLQVVDQETVLVTVEVDVLQHVLLADLKEQLQQLHHQQQQHQTITTTFKNSNSHNDTQQQQMTR